MNAGREQFLECVPCGKTGASENEADDIENGTLAAGFLTGYGCGLARQGGLLQTCENASI